MPTQSSITVRAQADYPFHYTCLFCGAENRDTIHFEAAKIEDVKSGTRKEHGVDLALAEARLRAELLESFGRNVEGTKKDVERFASHWKNCVDGVKPGAKRVVPMPMGFRCQCRACQQLQPYANDRYKGKKSTLFMVSLILVVAGLAMALFLLLASIGRIGEDGPLMRMIALVAGVVGVISIPVCVRSGKSTQAEEAAAQFEELRQMPFAPEKLPAFDDRPVPSGEKS